MFQLTSENKHLSHSFQLQNDLSTGSLWYWLFTFAFGTQTFSSYHPFLCHPCWLSQYFTFNCRGREASGNHKNLVDVQHLLSPINAWLCAQIECDFSLVVTQIFCRQMTSDQKNKSCRGVWKHSLAWSPKGLENCFVDKVNKLLFRAWTLNQRKHMGKHLISSIHYQFINGSIFLYSVSFISPTDTCSQQ